MLDGHKMDAEVSGRCLYLSWMFSDKFEAILVKFRGWTAASVLLSIL